MKLGPGAKTVLMLAGIVIAVAGLKLAAPLLVPLVTAVFITTVSLPIVRALTDRKVPRSLAILFAVLIDLAVLVGLAGLLAGRVDELAGRLPYYQERLAEMAVESATWVDTHGVHVHADRIAEAMAELRVMSLAADLFQSVGALVSRAVFLAFLVPLLVLFMLFESGPWRIKMAYVLHSPTQDLPRFANAAREVQTYLVVKSGLSVLTGGLCAGWVAVCGVDFPLLWGLLAFLLNFVPTLGMFIATIPPVVVALIQFGPGAALLVLAGYLMINFTLGNFVEPRVMGRALGLSPLVVFLSMVFWGWLWGPIGALLAVPLTMAFKILFAETEDLRWAAVLLGSAGWFSQQRRQWEDPFEAEKRRSVLPAPPEELLEIAAKLSPAKNPPLDTEDEFEGSGPRTIGGSEEPEPSASAEDSAPKIA